MAVILFPSRPGVVFHGGNVFVSLRYLRVWPRAHIILCGFVPSFVTSARWDFSESTSPISLNLQKRSASVPNITANFSELKVILKVQGQNRRTENLPLLIGRGLRYLHRIWQSDRSNFRLEISVRLSAKFKRRRLTL